MAIDCDHCRKPIRDGLPVDVIDEEVEPPVLVGQYCSRGCAAAGQAGHRAPVPSSPRTAGTLLWRLLGRA